MDRSNSGKRGTGGVSTPRKVYNVSSFKGETGQNSQSCSKIGCSGRIKCGQNAKAGNSDKSTCSKPSFCSSNGNETTGKSSSSRSISKVSCIDSKGKMSSEPSSSSNINGHQLESTSKTKEARVNNSSVSSSNVGPLKTFRQKSNQNTPAPSRSPAPGPYNRSKGSLKNPKSISTSEESESFSKNTMKKRSLEGESSSSNRGGKISTPPLPSSSGISISGSGTTGPVWARRSTNVNTRMRFSGQQNGQNSSSVINERPFSGSRSYRLSSNNGDNSSSRLPFASAEYDMDGIVEVLLALERIEQNEELTHEQFRALEAGLFLSGLNLHDQHRQMRLDIDNMSYEELLALEDRMGTVSTALSEEALSKCLTRSIYHSTPSNVQTSEDGDDIKCCICQEEYVNGDEIGKLVECEHGYHAVCVNEWLKVKNWCPICKASAEPSQS